MPAALDSPLLLYDGLCPLCNGVVKLILRTDRKGIIHFAPLQSDVAKRVLAKYPDLLGVDSVVLIVGGVPFVRSKAIFRLAQLLRGLWLLLAPFSLLPTRLADALYDLIARNRKSLGRYDVCPMMPRRYRDRFEA